MALYPDTTSFYSAKIVAGPLADKGKVSVSFFACYGCFLFAVNTGTDA